MKKGTFISLVALLVSIIGLMVALIAYFKRRSCALCDDLEDDMVEFYDEDEDDDDCCCYDCSEPEGASTAVEEAPAAEDELKF